ncbi:MAG: 4Fe-4S dicluster domain-containing protein [Chloroflexota bacterium]
MYEFSLDNSKCERCFDCVTACPRGVLEEGETGPIVAHPEECMGCWVCLAVCRNHGLQVAGLSGSSRPDWVDRLLASRPGCMPVLH